MDNENANDELVENKGSSLILDFRFLLLNYKKNVLKIALITIISMIITGVWVKVNVSPTWKSRCYMIMAPKNMSTPVEMPYLYQTFDIHTVLETVRIRDVLVDVIKKLNLKTTPEALFKSIDVQRGNRSSVLCFTATWPDREMSAKIANAAATSFIANNIKLMNSATEKIYQYYLQEKQNRLNAIQNLELINDQFREKNGVISISQESQSKFDQLKEVEIDLIKNQLKSTEMDSKIAEMNEKIGNVPDKAKLSWTYSQTDQRKLLELRRELESLRTKYTDENPKIIRILNDIKDLQKTTEAGSRDVPDAETWGPSGLIDVYTIDKSRFEAERLACNRMNKIYHVKIDSIRASIGNLTSIEKDYLEIDRQLQLNRDILRIVESRLAEALMSIQSNVSDYEIIESAKPPLFPEGTNRKLTVLGTGFLIFFLLSAFVLGKAVMYPLLKSDKDFSTKGMMQLIGLIPNEDQVDTKTYYKELQIFADNLLHIIKDIPNAKISFGSDIPETGKSFVINDVIKMLSLQKRKILYIDSINEITTETKPYIINDYLFSVSDSYQISKLNSNTSYAYLLKNDNIFIHYIDYQRIKSFLKAQTEFDLIIWELFDFSFNSQLFASIAQETDALILIGRYMHSSKSSFIKCTQMLKERKFIEVYGVLNNIKKDFFPKEL